MKRPRAPAAVRTGTPWGWALGGALLGSVTCLLLVPPARWLTPALLHMSDGRVSLEDARGTFWDGSADLVLLGGTGSLDRATLPSRLQWRLRPTGGGLKANLMAPCCMEQPLLLEVALGAGTVRVVLADSQSHWPASLVSGLGTPWNTLQPQGQLRLANNGLSVEWAAGRWAVAGRAQLDAVNISSRLSTLQPMGSYRITIQGGPTPTLALETTEGSLKLSGAGLWTGSRFRFDAVASTSPEHLDALSNLLNIIGRRDGARSIIKVG